MTLDLSFSDVGETVNTPSGKPSGKRSVGTVTKVFKDYLFITCDEVQDKDVYFKQSWFRGYPPLRESEIVNFELVQHSDADGTSWSARNLNRQSENSAKAHTAKGKRVPKNENLLQWAYLGFLPNVLGELAALALKGERWEFKNAPSNPDYPFPILWSYLRHTFGKLVLERKISVNEQASLATFNTGLVDQRYEKIYALFSPDEKAGEPQPWRLAGFCTAGEGANGQDLVRYFNPLPAPAHYFDNLSEVFYDTHAGAPELDLRHLIIDRIDRYPKEFIEDHLPAGFEPRDVTQATKEDRYAYYQELGNAIEQDSRTYRRIVNRVKDAVDLSIKRVSWNFKTAIPQYYPRVRALQLLLPLCLVSDEQVDMALAVEKTQSGKYLGHTALPLDWAYTNARLIVRPDSDWLVPEEINEGIGEPEDSDA